MAFPVRAGQVWHSMMPDATHDDISHQAFVTTMMNQMGDMMPGNRLVYENVVKLKFQREHKRTPKDVHEVRKAMLKEPYTQYWSSFKRCAKEMQYMSVGPMVERQLPKLIERARPKKSDRGSLTLDPKIKAPRYNTEVEIHAKPGGYHTDLTKDDVFAGAEFDRTFFVFTNGGTGSLNSQAGEFIIEWAKKAMPTFKPRAVLDMGCTIGCNTVPWVDAYPKAEVYGLDVAAPCLRYAHARAEALGKKIHFVQDNAEHTKFKDESFDLIVSCILMHEMSYKALHNVYRECHRLLRPGGVMIHSDQPPFRTKDLVEQFHTDWDTHFQAEPFITTLGLLDLVEVATKGGFQKSKVKEVFVPMMNGRQQYMLTARK
ncbi:MAG: class I SAM-dependent methyltransferase [Alphaproteobacteria bacterium]|nr:class I SAM-dependent methyltransferase [Alphaproteobacteria bacterium]